MNRIVKLTSPNLNYIMICGAFALIYSGTSIVTYSIATEALRCNVRIIFQSPNYILISESKVVY